ncbi:excalibur calcium-binding protein [Streptomyces sp. M41]|uniref:excalibur calcium-binding protein n=1 Tax=Streptomyces sp. M41 TaxID=3059412 RepID=UPI00374CFEA3
MRRHTGAVGTLIALAAIVPFAEPAHAQDRNCRDFTYQEDAQAHYNANPRDPDRLDEDQGPDDGIACESLPRRGVQGGDGGGRGGDGGGRGGDGDGGLISSTSRPSTRMTPTAPTAPVTSIAPATPATPATLAPTRGARGGLGGASTSGPSGWDVAVGLTFVTGAVLTAGYLVRRRRG